MNRALWWTTIVAVMTITLALTTLVPCGAEDHRVQRKGGKVKIDDPPAIDCPNNVETVTPDKVETVGGWLEVETKTLKPPSKGGKFKTFDDDDAPGQYVEVVASAGADASVMEEGEERIRLMAERDPQTPDNFKLEAEGNLTATGRYSLPTGQHWAAKTEDVKVYWETYDQPTDNLNLAIDDHPDVPSNGGKRIFPGKQAYNESDEVAAKRRYVFAVVEFPAGMTLPEKMWFRLWDVDDPSSDKEPIDKNNGPAGGDNRDADWHLANEDSSHMAEVAMGQLMRFTSDSVITGTESGTCEGNKVKCAVRVGMKPGDNYRFAVAWGEKAKLEAMSQKQADECKPPDGSLVSGMLTVWRKLHVEIDSMEREPFEAGHKGLDIRGIDCLSVTANKPEKGLTEVTTPNQLYHKDRYEGGYLWGFVAPGVATSVYRVRHHSANRFRENTIIIKGIIKDDQKQYFIGRNCTIADDDPLDPSPQLPVYPPIGPMMKRVYGAAYIMPVVVPAAENRKTTVPFYLNVENWYIVHSRDWWDARDLEHRPDYWNAHVIMSYQGPRPADMDPDGVALTPPQQPFVESDPEAEYGATYRDPSISAFVHVEVIREDRQNYMPHQPFWCHSIDSIMTHEVGHVAGLPDRRGQEEDIMNNPIYCPGHERRFLDEDVAKLRDKSDYYPSEGDWE